MLLRSLQAAANNKNQKSIVSWRALNTSNQNSGSPEVDYDRFAARWDQEDESGVLHQIVDRFDGNGLVLKTNNQEPQAVQGQQQDTGAVSKMAKHATQNAFN